MPIGAGKRLETDVRNVGVFSSLVLNAINFFLNKAIYCGVIGQMLIGIARGIDSGKLSGGDAERVLVLFGHLGSIMLL